MRGLTAFLIVLAAPALAAGQATCLEGRVVSEQSAGRCCWPGQSWDEEHARCDGPPACPGPLVAHGDDCVAAATPDPAAAPPTSPYPTTPSARDAAATEVSSLSAPGFARPFEEPVRIVSRAPLMGLYIAGIISLAVSYSYAVVLSAILMAEADSGCCGPRESWSLAIPLVGGVVWPVLSSNSSWPSAWFGVPATVAQALSVGMIVAGLLIERDVTVHHYGEPRVGAGPGELGASLVWDLF